MWTVSSRRFAAPRRAGASECQDHYHKLSGPRRWVVSQFESVGGVMTPPRALSCSRKSLTSPVPKLPVTCSTMS